MTSSSTTTKQTEAVRDFHARMVELFSANKDSDALDIAEARLADPELSVQATCAMAAIYYRAGALGYAIKMLAALVETGRHPSDLPEILAVLYSQAGSLSDALYYAKLSSTEEQTETVSDFFIPALPGFSEAFGQVVSKPLLARGKAMMGVGDLEQARFMLEQHLALFSHDVEALDSYAQVLIQLGDISEAIGLLRSVATLAGPSATLLSRLAHCLIMTGHHQDGLACHQEAVARGRTSLAVLGAAVADLRYLEPSQAEASGLVQAWMAQVTASAPKTARPAPKYAGAVPVRICYLCSAVDDPDLRAMIGAVARAHDRGRVRVIGFGKGEAESSQNLWSHGAFDLWRDVSGLDTPTLGALIRGEGSHVVIDADGLLAPARGGLFMRNTAPLQLTWLNTPVVGHSLGQQLTLVPGEAGEGELGLPAGRYCLADPAGEPLTATPAPVETAGAVTFGVEVSLPELTPRLALILGRVLQDVPGSTLVFRDNGLFRESDAVDRLVNLFGNAGVSHRVDVVQSIGRADFAAAVDVMLMPFPSADILAYGAFLRVGVPVVTLASSPAGNDMAAVLNAAGLGEHLVAADPESYVAKAVALAADPAGLIRLRRELPQRLSPVAAFSAKAFATMIEDTVIAALGRLPA